MAEAAVWNVALSDAEVVALAANASPKMIRPGNLVWYMDLIRDVREVISNNTIAHDGTVPIAHTLITYPYAREIVKPIVVTGMLPFNSVKQVANYQSAVGGMNG